MWQVHNAYNEIRYERRYPSGLIQGISSFKSFWKLNLCPDIIVCQVMIWVCDDDSSCILVSFLVTLELDIMYIVTLQLLWYIVMSLDNILLPSLRWKIDRENWYIYIKKSVFGKLLSLSPKSRCVISNIYQFIIFDVKLVIY